MDPPLMVKGTGVCVALPEVCDDLLCFLGVNGQVLC